MWHTKNPLHIKNYGQKYQKYFIILITSTFHTGKDCNRNRNIPSIFPLISKNLQQTLKHFIQNFMSPEPCSLQIISIKPKMQKVIKVIHPITSSGPQELLQRTPTSFNSICVSPRDGINKVAQINDVLVEKILCLPLMYHN